VLPAKDSFFQERAADGSLVALVALLYGERWCVGEAVVPLCASAASENSSAAHCILVRVHGMWGEGAFFVGTTVPPALLLYYDIYSTGIITPNYVVI
jgi:hypothetical protein